MTDPLALFTAPATIPFSVALAVLLGIAAIETLGLLLASSPSAWIEQMLPGFDGDADADGDGIVDGPLGWLHAGKVPLLVLLILFLLGFALGGYALQLFARATLGAYVPAWIASAPALLVGLGSVCTLGGLIAHIVPKDESSAVSEQSLVGRAGELRGATARRGLAGQARVRDAHGHLHYLRVEPDVDGEELADGEAILIVRKTGATYRGIRNPHPDLL